MKDEILDILKKVGAVITDSHFVGTSGKHFATYINKDALYPHTKETSNICKMFGERAKGLGVEVVVGPALGGIILSTWTAYHLSQMLGKEILGVYTEKTPEGGMAFTREYDKLVSGKKVLVIEDLVTTGGSVKKVIDAVKAAGGNVVAVGVMINKSPATVTSEFFGVPFLPLAILEVPTYNDGQCPLCKAGVPINTTIGHGKKYLETKGKK